MKRSAPLRRKTPLKRGGKLRPMSRAKAAMQPRYRLQLSSALERQVKTKGHHYCELCDRRCEPGPHHTHGRIGVNLLTFILICWNPCHVWINQHQKEARAKGLIQ